MKYKLLNKVVITSVFIFSCVINSASAGLITIGALSSNDVNSTEVITDSLNNLEWLRWDQLKDKTHSELLVETAATGAYSGWNIAGVKQANWFLSALYNDASLGNCSINEGHQYCALNGSFTSKDYTSLLGDSFEVGKSSADAVWFYDDTLSDGKAGYLLLESGSLSQKFNEFGTIAATEVDSLFTGDNSTGWLMYRSTAVPEPRTLAIFALGVLGLSFRRFKK
jgi:hypothetical protein